MNLEIQLDSLDERTGTVVKAYGYEAVHGERVKIETLFDPNRTIQEREEVVRDADGSLVVLSVRHWEDSKVPPLELTKGATLIVGHTLEGVQSPWPRETEGMFVDVAHFPGSFPKLVETNDPGHYRGKGVRIEPVHATRDGKVHTTYNVWIGDLHAFEGEIAKHDDHFTRYVSLR